MINSMKYCEKLGNAGNYLVGKAVISGFKVMRTLLNRKTVLDEDYFNC